MADCETPGFEPTLVTSRWNLVQFALLACYTTGFHGVTSFPYYIHKHSGLFLVAFYVVIVLICIPICYVQIKMGALFKRGVVSIFSILVPILKGAAVSMLVLTYIRCLLHSLELSYALHFAVSSLQATYPWAATSTNVTTGIEALHRGHAERYFHEDFLQTTEHVGDGGYVVWYIALSLLATWSVTFILTCRGTAMMSKLAYVITPVTLLALTVVLVYGYVTIPHAGASVNRLLTSEGEQKLAPPASAGSSKSTDRGSMSFLDEAVNYRLGHPGPWVDALNLHMHSLGLWSGVLPTLGTLVVSRKYTVNAWIILLLVYSILPQIALFALAPYIDTSDHGVFISSGRGIKPGLPFLFVAIPSTFAQMELSPIISFCLFISVFLFGLHHQALHLLAIWDNLLPSTPKFLMSYFRRREVLVAAACGVSFLLAVPYTIQGGIHLYAIINSYVDRLTFTIIIISTVPFLLGYIKQEILYIPIERAFMSLWYGIAALVSSVLLIYYFAEYVYPYPVAAPGQSWAGTLGWTVAAAPVALGVLIGGLHAICKLKGTFKQRFLESLRSESFSPGDDSHEYTSAENTGDTVMHHPNATATATLASLPPEIPEVEKTETEVFVQPIEDADDPVHV